MFGGGGGSESNHSVRMFPRSCLSDKVKGKVVPVLN
jgi:hypothetical protein